MKNINSFMVAVVALFAAISCTQELDYISGVDTSKFTAFWDGVNTTKTSLNADLKSVWMENDAIWVLNGKSGNNGWKKLYKTLDNNSLSATFREDDKTSVLEGNLFFAIYPAIAADKATWNGRDDINKVELSSNQVATSASYDPAAHLAIARTSTNTLNFINAVSLLKFKVSKEGIKSVTISSLSGTKLSGTCNISADGKVTPWTGSGESKDWVELKMATGTFEVGQEYYIAVFPGKHSNGFKVEFSADGSSKGEVKSYKNEITFGRNQILNLDDIDYKVPATVEKIYFKPTYWNNGNSSFFVHFYNSIGETNDVKMLDSDKDGIYEATVPRGYSSATFCRLPKSATTLNWQNVYSKVENVTLPQSGSSNIYYVISGDSQGSWNSKPTTKTIYLNTGGNSLWDQGGANFVGWIWGGGDKWVYFQKGIEGMYYVEVPTATTGIICMRKGPNMVDGWTKDVNYWNKTNDVTLGKNNCITITGWDETSRTLSVI